MALVNKQGKTVDYPDGYGLGATFQIWPGEDGPWLLTLQWQLVKGRAECVGISVTSVYDDSTPQGRKLPEIGTPLTTTVLRNLKLAEIIAAHREMNAYLWGELAGEQQLATAYSKPASMRESTAKRLQRVASTYRAAWGTGERPTRAVARAFGVSDSAAAKLVYRARAAGLLPRTSPGVAGGVGEGAVDENDAE